MSLRRGVPLLVLLLLGARVRAETPAELEGRLPSQAGPARARTLCALTDALAEDDPRKAVEYGLEALELLAKHPDPVLEISTLPRLGWAHMLLSQYDTASEVLERARRLAESRGDQAGLAQALNVQGVLARRRGDPLGALAFFTRCLEIHRRLGDEAEAAMSLNNLGFVYSADLADYDRALDYHLQALAVRERLGNQEEISLSLNNIGVIYNRLGEHRKALDHLTRALDLRRKLGIKARIAGTLSNIGDVHMDQGDHERGLAHHLEALALRRQVGDHSAMAHSLRNIGVCETALGHPDRAQRALAEALRLAEEVKDKEMLARTLLAQAQLETRRDAFAPAEESAQRALVLSREISNKELVRRTLRDLAAIQESAGRPAAALATFKAFKEASDAIFDQEKARRLAVLEAQYLAQKRDREVERLTKEQAVQEVEIHRQKRERNALLVLSVLLGVVGLLFYRRRTEMARITETLSVTDPLTGLRNRRYVLQTIDADLATSRRAHATADGPAASQANGDIVFMLVDLDLFKGVNDQYGHVAGDRVLVEVARRMRVVCRDSDVVVRWGGEEFLIVSRFTNRTRASLQAERLRRAVSDVEFDVGEGRRTRLTASLGFAAYPFAPRQSELLGWEDVVALADEALYAAKLSRRDAWVGLTAGEGTLPDASQLRRAPESWVIQGVLTVESSLEVERLRWRG